MIVNISILAQHKANGRVLESVSSVTDDNRDNLRNALGNSLLNAMDLIRKRGLHASEAYFTVTFLEHS